VQSALHWVRKMASVGELDDRGGPAPSPPPRAPAEPGGSGIGSTGPTRPPEPDTPGPGPGPGPVRPPEPPAPPAPEELRVAARRAFEALQEWERAQRADLPAVQAAYEQFLADFPDTTLPEYMKAALRLGEVTDRMRAVYKEITDNDPDGIDGIDSRQVGLVVTRLTGELSGKDPEARVRAARLLGGMGTGLAAYSLARTLRDSDSEVSAACRESLIRIGGPRVAYNLTKLYHGSSPDNQRAALDILQTLAKKSPADARVVSVPLGRFVLCNNQEVADSAVQSLVALGPLGGPGLVEALGTIDPNKKVVLIRAIGTARYYRGATRIGQFLLQGDDPRTRAFREAAADALKSMGVHAVPHLIPLLQSGRYRLWTAEVLRQITGTRYTANNASKFREWYEENKPADAPESR
jgi:hypothetical protein